MLIQPKNYLILIVDDTPANVRLLSFVLEKEGFKVISALNGKEGIEQTKKESPDLILLDVMMPDMSGFEVSSELKKDTSLSEIPIIFLSALSESDVKVKGFKAGGVDYITKPFKKEETLARISTHLYLRTLQKKLNERINILREREIELSQLNLQKDNLVRMVSHDIKNPLTGILGLVKLMKADSEIPLDERKYMFSVIEESGNKLLDLVRGVLDREENKTKTEKLELRETNLMLLAEQVIQLNNPKAVIKDIDLTIKADLNEKVLLDANKIEIALNNLVSNALKFTQNGGKVSIEISKSDEEKIIIKVRDTGIGIPEITQKHIFDSLKRSSTLGTGGEAGSGLGLDIVQHYVEMHDGSIRVESELTKGTCFFIELPLINIKK